LENNSDEISLVWAHQAGCPMSLQTPSSGGGSVIGAFLSFIFWTTISVYLFGVGLNFALGERTLQGLLVVHPETLKEFFWDILSRIKGRNQYVSL
jgi:hypothetical protein